jgi:hypothetical protein
MELLRGGKPLKEIWDTISIAASVIRVNFPMARLAIKRRLSLVTLASLPLQVIDSFLRAAAQ